MEAFVRHTGVVVALNRANVDTDAIIPKQFLKSIQRSGFGQYLFDAWRYLDQGEPGMDCSKRPINPDFELNRPEFANGSILLAGPNFGCGSSREHAPWALQQYGFKTIIAPSYADIFFNNCFKNGLLPIVLKEDAVENMFAAVASQPGITATVDLANQTVTLGELQYAFSVDEFRKHCLMHGLDDIGLTLQHQAQIRTFESQHLSRFPWLGNTI